MYTWLAAIALVVLLDASTCSSAVVRKNQPCSGWTGYSDSNCAVKLVTMEHSSAETITFDEYDKIRIAFTDGEFLINGAQNIKASTDSGKPFDYRTLRFRPGSYVIEKVNTNAPASFGVVYPFGETQLNLEYVYSMNRTPVPNK